MVICNNILYIYIYQLESSGILAVLSNSVCCYVQKIGLILFQKTFRKRVVQLQINRNVTHNFKFAVNESFEVEVTRTFFKTELM